MQVSFTVEGRPVPQGSMVASYNRKQGVSRVHHVQGAALAQWRASIALAAREAGGITTTLPVRLTVQFGMPRPKAHMVLRGGRYVVRMQHYYARPAVAPDIDKLARGVLDALTNVLYVDDCQVVELLASKVYADRTYIEVSSEGLSVQTEAFASLSVGLGVNTPKDTGTG